MEYVCEFCKQTLNYLRHASIIWHQNFCKANPNRKVMKGHKWSEEDKKLISERRKNF